MIVWLHGGGWRFGDRRLAPDLSRYFASSGFAMASIDYRLTTDAIFPAQIEDVKTAIRVAPRGGIARYGFDGRRIGLWGASAGGHLASSRRDVWPQVCSRAPLPSMPEQSSDVQAVVDGYGPTDFLQMDAHRDPFDRPSGDPESITACGDADHRANSFESLLVGGPIEQHQDRVRPRQSHRLQQGERAAVPDPARAERYDGPGAPERASLRGPRRAGRRRDLMLRRVSATGS